MCADIRISFFLQNINGVSGEYLQFLVLITLYDFLRKLSISALRRKQTTNNLATRNAIKKSYSDDNKRKRTQCTTITTYEEFEDVNTYNFNNINIASLLSIFPKICWQLVHNFRKRSSSFSLLFMVPIRKNKYLYFFRRKCNVICMQNCTIFRFWFYLSFKLLNLSYFSLSHFYNSIV